MALIGFWGFDHIGATADIKALPGWDTSSGAWSSVAGLLGGLGITGNAGSPSYIYQSGNTYSTLIIGFRYLHKTVGSTADILRFLDGTSVQVGLAVNNSNKILLFRGTNSTVIATGTTSFVDSTWYFLELKITFHNTTGTYELRIGGSNTPEFSGTGANTRNTANNQATGMNINCATATNNGYDDVYLLDTSGSAPLNDFLGVIRVETVFPTAADGSPQWTPNASTNVSRINGTTPDGDTTYNSTSTSGNIDFFTHGSISSTPVTIFAVAVTSEVRKDDVTARSVRNKLKSSGTVANGASFSTTTSYQYTKDYFTSDPNTSLAWASASAINSTSIGYEYV